MSSPALTEVVTLANGVAMPTLGLGTYEMSGKVCEEAVVSAIRAGFRLVDTASMYGNEKQVGAAIRRVAADGVPRESLFVSSKLYPTEGYEKTLAAFNQTLGNLGLKYLDLYLIHWPGGGAEKRKGAWRAMEELLASGRVRAIGVSNYMERHVQEIADAGFKTLPHVNQCELHPQCQWNELRAYCQSKKVVFMGYMPFGGEGAPLLRDKAVARAAALATKAAGRPVSPAQLLVRFVRSRSAVAIPRSRDPQHQVENAQIGFEIGEEAEKVLVQLDSGTHYDWDPTSIR